MTTVSLIMGDIPAESDDERRVWIETFAKCLRRLIYSIESVGQTLAKNDAPERKLRFFVPPFVRSDLSDDP
jgi:hypothetical protein